MTPLLEVRNLSKTFPVDGGRAHIHAVSEVNLSLETGEVIGIVGESGCGKSTLARLVLRLLQPTQGSIAFSGRDLLALGTREMRNARRHMQMVFQDPFASLDSRQKVGAILEEPLLIHKVGTRAQRRARVFELLEHVGLPGDACERYPHEFSGGQRQRINIARALALSPRLIVADEPVSALDMSIQSQILNLLEDLKSEFGLSYLFISHDLAVIRHISNKVAVMYLGRIVEFADSETLFTTPAHPYTQALLSAIPNPDPRVRRERVVLKGDVPSPEDPPTGCAFHPRCPQVMDECATRQPLSHNLGGTAGSHRVVSCHLYG